MAKIKRYTKRQFVIAYRELYGATYKQANEVWKNATCEYIIVVVESYLKTSNDCFYND